METDSLEREQELAFAMVMNEDDAPQLALWCHQRSRGANDDGQAPVDCASRQGRSSNIHKVVLEKVLQLSLSCRVGQVANVQTAALCGGGRGSLVGGGLVIEGGVAQSVGNVIDGGIRSLLHVGSRHF